MVGFGRDKPEEWIQEFRTLKDKNGVVTQEGVDGVVLICGSEDKVKATTDELAREYFSSTQGVEHVLTLDGKERPGENRGHEQ